MRLNGVMPQERVRVRHERSRLQAAGGHHVPWRRCGVAGRRARRSLLFLPSGSLLPERCKLSRTSWEHFGKA
jgi:hypothetical protein